MEYKFETIRLDKLNIPAESLRQTATPAANAILEESLQKHGVIVPLIVSRLNKSEFSLWDGTRRVTALRKLGTAGTIKLPALIVTGGDSDAVVAQLNINQARERLTDLAEAEGLRQLVQDHGWQQIDAAKQLLKTRSWASKIMKVWQLPKNVLSELRKGNLPLSHCMVLSRYIDKPNILNMLLEETLKGNISSRHLAAMGFRAEKDGLQAAKKKRPKQFKLSDKSWVRAEPLQKGTRLEIHLDESDKPEDAIKKLLSIIDKIY